jgi:hypothetical protein
MAPKKDECPFCSDCGDSRLEAVAQSFISGYIIGYSRIGLSWYVDSHLCKNCQKLAAKARAVALSVLDSVEKKAN